MRLWGCPRRSAQHRKMQFNPKSGFRVVWGLRCLPFSKVGGEGEGREAQKKVIVRNYLGRGSGRRGVGNSTSGCPRPADGDQTETRQKETWIPCG